MPDIALYYLYSHVRDEAWMKAAALYLPRLAVLTPQAYPRRRSWTVDVLRDELGFLVDVDPARKTYGVAKEFAELIDTEGESLRAQYAWPDPFPAELYDALDHDSGGWSGHVPDDRVEWVHIGKLPVQLFDQLADTRLGEPSPDRSWIALHPRLGSVYLAALADRVAQANGMPVITDQPSAHGALNGWDIGTLARVLLEDEAVDAPISRTADGVAALYAALAVNAYVPDQLADVPVERIVDARRKLAPEFDAFCAHLDSLAAQFAELAQVEDQGVLVTRLGLLAERDLLRSATDLDRGLRMLGLQPVRAVLSLKSLALPAVPFAAAAFFGLPAVVGAAGVIVAQFVASGVQALQVGKERRRSAPGYLLGLRKELSPTGVIERIHGTFHRASLGQAPGRS